ncbi:IclR family transcriptional regulator [Streptomyces sp. DSM 44915]|uniref:IclR family transcriptional regulator n=1 Tax=Streptomyces chisholmiae TaxID=3075540 RepID=A0ABU2JLZ8_9ACTN|nr:IclR family transcriptional regulator [Streptomyces sp. DSM 44915]MDT0265994.1 IclR family transcriptional regulator [Streptomyces sp. DSM 44915]
MSERGGKVTIQSVDRAFTILEVLADSSAELPLGVIATQTGLSASTCHHLLSTMSRRGYVAQNPADRKYTLGAAARKLGRPNPAQLNLGQLADPVMRAIHGQTQETVVLAVLHGSELTMVSSLESPHAIRAGYGWGELSDAAHATAAGKAILAWLPEAKTTALVRDKGLTRFTGCTIDSADRLIESLRLVRRHDLATERDEFVEGLTSAAVAIRTEDGAVLGSLGCCLPTMRATDERLRAVQELLGSGARAIARSHAQSG